MSASHILLMKNKYTCVNIYFLNQTEKYSLSSFPLVKKMVKKCQLFFFKRNIEMLMTNMKNFDFILNFQLWLKLFVICSVNWNYFCFFVLLYLELLGQRLNTRKLLLISPSWKIVFLFSKFWTIPTVFWFNLVYYLNVYF